MDRGTSEVAAGITFPAIIRATIGRVHCVYNACESQADLDAYLAEHQFRAGRDSLTAEPPSSGSS